MEEKMRLKSLLDAKEVSYFLLQKGDEPDIVVAAIHHAPAGVLELPCEEHKDSDEAVGQLALKLTRSLKCTFIVASNYFRDPNKSENTDYCTWLLQNRPRVLIEIHGHSGKKATADIEISSGEKRNHHSRDFADKLKKCMSRRRFKRQYSVSGDYPRIRFKATEAVTINSDAWLAFHIELCPELRQDNLEAKRIAGCIAYAVKGIWSEMSNKKEAT
jgi:hypothetical protein